MPYPDVLNRLIEQFKKLPGVGSRTAERLAVAVSGFDRQEAAAFADAIQQVARSLRVCSVCCVVSDRDPCRICSDSGRERDRILVVESASDLNAFEDAGWRGLYHVLRGRIDPAEGVLPEHLTVDALKRRLETDKVAEVVIATSPDFEGDGTALVLLEALKGAGVAVSRIARGVPTGRSIEYASRAALSDALEGRTAVR